MLLLANIAVAADMWHYLQCYRPTTLAVANINDAADILALLTKLPPVILPVALICPGVDMLPKLTLPAMIADSAYMFPASSVPNELTVIMSLAMLTSLAIIILPDGLSHPMNALPGAVV
jgi:hypothetical protein